MFSPSSVLNVKKGDTFAGRTVNEENIKVFLDYFKSKGAKVSANAEGNVEVSASRDWFLREIPITVDEKEINAFFAQQQANNPSPVTQAISPVLNYMYKQPLMQKAYEQRVPLALTAVGLAGMVVGACAMRYKMRS